MQSVRARLLSVRRQCWWCRQCLLCSISMKKKTLFFFNNRKVNLLWKMCHIMQNSSMLCCCILSRFSTIVQSHCQNVPPTMQCKSFFQWLIDPWMQKRQLSAKEMEWKLVCNTETKSQPTQCMEFILNYVYFMQAICINSCNQCVWLEQWSKSESDKKYPDHSQ